MQEVFKSYIYMETFFQRSYNHLQQIVVPPGPVGSETPPMLSVNYLSFCLSKGRCRGYPSLWSRVLFRGGGGGRYPVLVLVGGDPSQVL